MPPPQKSVALLATGDEIKNGDILNTNSQAIATKLFSLGIPIGTHLVTGDQITDIENAIKILLQDHDALIITGGLGPTSDDLTRYALANATHCPLKHDEPTWQSIVSRLKSLGYDTPPSSNQQQALFPEGAAIIQNPNGTAAGCRMLHNDKWIFMLPGPPTECLPMLASDVIPTLLNAQFQTTQFHRKWLLFGVSEGEIAERLDAIAKPFDCTTGYRIWYPYIEFKIFSCDEHQFNQLVPLIHDAVKKYILEDGSLSASEQLKKLLPALVIDDQATGGTLESLLLTPETYGHLSFGKENATIKISGLADYWQNNAVKTTKLCITIDNETTEYTVPLRGDRVKLYAAEWVCLRVYKHLSQ